MVLACHPDNSEDEDAHTSLLLDRVCAGDVSAFDELQERYYDRVFGYARFLLGDPVHAEAAAHNAWVAAHEELMGSRSPAPAIRTWLFGLARRTTLQSSGSGSTPTEPGDHRSPVGQMAFAVSGAGMVERMDALPLAQREALYLHFEGGLAPEEIAAIVGRAPEEATRVLDQAISAIVKCRPAARADAPRRL